MANKEKNVEWRSKKGVPLTGYARIPTETEKKKANFFFRFKRLKIKKENKAIKELKIDEWKMYEFQLLPKNLKKKAWI